MKYQVIKSIDLNNILTIVFRGNSDAEVWRDGFVKPFILLNEETMYSVVYVISKKLEPLHMQILVLQKVCICGYLKD